MSNVTAVEPIRIIVADDHLVVRAGLKALLAGEPDIQVVGEAANGREALALIDRVSPDVAVIDLAMPVMDGLSALQTLVARGSPTRVLILTMHDEDEYLATLLAAGAAGYLVKSAADRELTDAIRAVAAGDTYRHRKAPPASEHRAPPRPPDADERLQLDGLSAREREVLMLVAEGYSASEIGDRLLISPKTVETYKQRVSDKLALRHRSAYVQFCLRLDLLHPHG